MEDPELNPTRDRVYLVSEVVSQLNYQGVCLKRQKPSVNFITSVSRTSLAEATKAFDSGESFSRYSNVFNHFFLIRYRFSSYTHIHA